jgi:hypothetical protein
MLVDVIVPGWVPFKDLGGANDVPGFVQAMTTPWDTTSRRSSAVI